MRFDQKLFMPMENKAGPNKLFLFGFGALLSFIYFLAGMKIHATAKALKHTTNVPQSRVHSALDTAAMREPPPLDAQQFPNEPAVLPEAAAKRQHLDTHGGKHAGMEKGEHMAIPAGIGFQPGESREEKLAQGWHPPKAEKLPKPTYWPASLAFGITVLAWGPLTSWIIAAVGCIVCVASLAGWIGDLRYER